ncbi:hypothetical protein B0H11DRAFT_1911721 [Mycena galericulata]|nr:hypothetical protein B0H11DRAFT_1911721 [Mycena galericulata]
MTHAESIGYSHTEMAGGTPPLGLLKGGWSANIRGIILTKGDQVERLLHQNKNRKQTEEGASKKMLDSSQYHDPESNGVRGGWTDEGRTHFHHGVFFSLKLGVEEWIERWRKEVSKRMGTPSKIIEDVLKLIHLELNGVLTALACNRGHMFLLGNFGLQYKWSLALGFERHFESTTIRSDVGILNWSRESNYKRKFPDLESNESFLRRNQGAQWGPWKGRVD